MIVRVGFVTLLYWGAISTVLASTYDSTIQVPNISVQKPAGNTFVAGEALTAWEETDATIGSGGLWGSTDFLMNLTPSAQTYLDSGNTYSVFSTGIQGIGFVLGVISCDGFGGINSCKSLSPITGAGDYKLADGLFATNVLFKYYVKLVTTGESIQSGVYGASQIGYSQLHSGGTDTNAVTLSSFAVTFTQQGCAIQASPAVVDMGIVSRARFNGVNTTVNGPPVIVSLTCGSGLNNVFAVISDVNNSANTGSILTVSGGATGVGVRFIKDDGSAVLYSPDASYVGAPNQFQINTSADLGSLYFTLTPQYIQTQNSIGVGVANALASITLSYD